MRPTVCKPYHVSMDTFIWRRQVAGFSIKFAYARLMNDAFSCSYLDDGLSHTRKLLRKPNVLSKIQVFEWRFLLNRLQTRDELVNQGMLRGFQNLVCPLSLGP